ncbi:unnamed protein product (macronuclear) [Paramecium tetraurelia]|uniref:Transmembrane protein n=1 Tax=Paramecium tetraurelia TaxID=5888 RepID=A0DSN5_PARTE|nr:uncharacterized protein GSPATT00019745001 [Paramecium tetraurelia]CAK86052.1 unnamed protein product [Paramecium tetraurelia]|eukprot:XP_001453449.1 hypothetical protein (macronuclear) [Paramecium tetraurelia strain d4-2]
MELINQKCHKYNEGWSERELLAKQKLSTRLTILTLLFAIGLIVVSLVFFNQYSFTIMILLLMSAIFSLILCGIIFYWFNTTTVRTQDDHQQTHEVLDVDQRFSIVVFLGSFLNILFNCFLLVFIVFWYRIGKDFYLARHYDSQTTPTQYMSYYTYGLYIAIPIVILISLMLMYVAFTSYITIQQKNQLRVCIYVFSLTTIIIASFALLYSNQVLADLATPYSPIAPNRAFTIFYILAVGAIITALISFLLTFIYRNDLFETVGYANLIIIFLIAACSFHVIRLSEQVRTTYINDCTQQMRNTHESWMQENAQCKKYLEKIQCEPQNQAISWETDSTQKCLNISCCNAFSDSMSQNLFKAGFSILLLVISGFALSMALLQVDTSVKTQQIPNRTLDWIFVLLAIIIFIFSFLLVFSVPTLPPQMDNIIIENQKVIKENKSPLVYPTGIENVTGCEPLINVFKQQNNNKDIDLKGNSRVTILAPKMQVVVTEYVNSPNVSYIPKLMIKNILYPQANENTDGMFGVQGNKDEIKNILQNHVQICSEGEKKIQIDIYEIETAKNTRLLWQRHRTHEEEKKFSQNQKEYINNLKFTNLQVNIVDIQTGQELNDVILYFYKNEDDCGRVKPIPSRLITVDQDSVLYNMVVKEYYFGAEKKGYYLYCNKFKNTQETKSLEVTMIPRSTIKGQFTVVLETPKHNKFELLLGASYTECTVGFFNENCGGLKFYGSENAQAIYVNQLAERKYTFFVAFDPIDPKLKELNIKKQQGHSIDTSAIDNDPIFKEIKPVITLYASEQERPIIRYQLPQVSNLKNEPNLTWLVLCVDGSIGDISQKSPAQFWTYQANPNKLQRPSNSKEIYPQICNNI